MLVVTKQEILLIKTNKNKHDKPLTYTWTWSSCRDCLSVDTRALGSGIYYLFFIKWCATATKSGWRYCAKDLSLPLRISFFLMNAIKWLQNRNKSRENIHIFIYITHFIDKYLATRRHTVGGGANPTCKWHCSLDNFHYFTVQIRLFRYLYLKISKNWSVMEILKIHQQSNSNNIRI